MQDFSEIKTREEALATLKEANRAIATQMPNSVLAISDIRRAYHDPEVVKATKEAAAHDKPYVIAEAVIGISPLTNIIFSAVKAFTGRNFHACRDVEEAKEWLLEQRLKIKGY